jgi:Secretion system C-terminal sorting domain/SprB repeat
MKKHLTGIAIFLVLMTLSINSLGQCGIIISDTVIKPPTCYGYNDGLIKVTVVGDGTPLIVDKLWTNTVPLPTTNTNVVKVPAGIYFLNITDSSGCTQTFEFQVPQRDSIQIHAQDKLVCPGNGVRLIDSISNTRGPVHLSWTSTSGLSCNQCPNGIVHPTFTQTYEVLIEDTVGCKQSKSIKINVPDSLKADYNIKPDNCDGNGKISISVSGGIEDFTYGINGAAQQSNDDFEDLKFGFYVIRIIDSLGCRLVESVTVPNKRALVNPFLFKMNAVCIGEKNGLLKINTIPGSAKLFSIDSVNFQTNPLFPNLKSGNYRAFIEDTNECMIVRPFRIEEPVPPLLTTTKTDLSCFESKDGILVINTKRGSNPIEKYAIDNPANKQVSAIFKNLKAAKYRVFAIDTSQCVYPDSIELFQPEEIIVDTTEITDNTCSGESEGEIIVNVPANKQYLYSLNGVFYQASDTFRNLRSGFYNLFVQDTNGCQILLQVEVDEPDASTADFIIDSVSCFGNQDGKIIVLTSGGTGVHQFSLDGEKYYFSNTFDSLSSGIYTIFIRDSNNCVTTDIAIVGGPDELTVDFQLSMQNGLAKIDLTIVGGYAPYHVLWSTGDTIQDLDSIGSGNYVVTVIDSNGCVIIDSINFVITGTGVDLPDGQLIQIYPNPTSGIVNLEFDLIKKQEIKIQVINILGQLLMTKTIDPGKQISTLDLKKLPPGFYTIRMIFKEQTVSRKIIKQ